MTTSFDLSSVFRTVASAIPDQTALVWRDRRLSYAEMDARIDGFANYLVGAGLGVHTERDALANHESGQDHLGIYLRNGNEYLEAMIGSFRARVAPFNVSFRYVADELVYLLDNAKARVLVYGAEFAPQVTAIREKLPHLEFLIQVADDSGNELLPGAVDYESIMSSEPPTGGMPVPSPDDLYILYTGGTTGMPKGVLWRQHDIFVSSMGGRPYGSDRPMDSYEQLAELVQVAPGAASMLVMLPLMHGAGQWASMSTFSMGGRVVLPDNVTRVDAESVLALAEREKVRSIPAIGDALIRPLLDELERNDYDLSSLVSIPSSGALLTPTVRDRLLAVLPHIVVVDSVGASETGLQMSSRSTSADTGATQTFTPQPDTAVVATDFSRVLDPGGGLGWLARSTYVPLGYLDDEVKTAQTFPVIQGTRWSVPGDRANALADGGIELLGRDSVTINTGGEKVFAEEVERAVAAHPDVYDVVVVGRPSERWGNEVVAVVQLAPGASPTDEELAAVCEKQIARYKIPKAFIRTAKVMRSPVGKADYRWAKQVANESLSATAD